MIDGKIFVLDLSEKFTGREVSLRDINEYAKQRIINLLHDERHDNMVHDLVHRSFLKGSIISSASLFYLKNHERDFRDKYEGALRTIEKKNRRTIEQDLKERFPELGDCFELNDTDLKSKVKALEDSIAQYIELDLNTTEDLRVLLSHFKQDLDLRQKIPGKLKEIIPEDKYKEYKNLFRFYTRKRILEEWNIRSRSASLKDSEDRLIVMDLDRYTFDDFLQDSLSGLLLALEDDTKKYKLAHELLSKENIGISFGFGFVEDGVACGIDMSKSQESFWSIIIGLSKIAHLTTYTSNVKPLNTIVHEAIHIESQYFSRYEVGHIVGYNDYAKRLTCAINLINEQSSQYTKPTSRSTNRYLVFLEDELVANLIGNIFASSPNEESARKALTAKLSTDEYTVSFPHTGEGDTRERTFNVKEELLPIIQKVFQAYKDRMQDAQCPKLLRNFDMVIECCKLVEERSQAVQPGTSAGQAEAATTQESHGQSQG